MSWQLRQARSVLAWVDSLAWKAVWHLVQALNTSWARGFFSVLMLSALGSSPLWTPWQLEHRTLLALLCGVLMMAGPMVSWHSRQFSASAWDHARPANRPTPRRMRQKRSVMCLFMMTSYRMSQRRANRTSLTL